jgi:hypothetical protein
MAGAMRKTATLRNIPAAFCRQSENWASQTVRYIKQSYKGGRVFRRPPVDLDERLDMRVKRQGEEMLILIGTGVHIGRKEVVYAQIQEEGGTVKPRGHPFLTIPLPGVKGTASQYPHAFLATTASGQWMLAEPKGKTGIRPLFLLRRSVTLPARRWFSRPIEERKPELERMTSEEAVWARAERMGAAQTAKGGGE